MSRRKDPLLDNAPGLDNGLNAPPGLVQAGGPLGQAEQDDNDDEDYGGDKETALRALRDRFDMFQAAHEVHVRMRNLRRQNGNLSAEERSAITESRRDLQERRQEYLKFFEMFKRRFGNP